MLQNFYKLIEIIGHYVQIPIHKYKTKSIICVLSSSILNADSYERHLKAFRIFFLMSRVGKQFCKKSGPNKKTPKITQHFFVTKTTDLKTIFLKNGRQIFVTI